MVEGSLSGCSGVLFWAGCCSWFVISVVLVGVSSPVCCCSFGERLVAPLRFCGREFGVGWGGVSVLGFAGVSLKDRCVSFGAAVEAASCFCNSWVIADAGGFVPSTEPGAYFTCLEQIGKSRDLLEYVGVVILEVQLEDNVGSPESGLEQRSCFSIMTRCIRPNWRNLNSSPLN
ncbi:unnamed protein product [Amaranthus hypochondriacus]